VHPTLSTAIDGLSLDDKRRIVEALASERFTRPDIELDPTALGTSGDSSLTINQIQELAAELITQRDLMVSVATGGPRINDVNDYYRARRRRLARLLAEKGLGDPNPHEDLWDWYNHWNQHYNSYAERRAYIASLFDPLISRVTSSTPTMVPAREPTGWERVDRTVDKARARFDSADSEEDFQSIGLLCREVLISLGQAVYEPASHPTIDGVDPSSTDAKRMLEAFLGAVVPGDSNESVRRHAKAALALALDLQHRRTATQRQAAICLEATSSTVNIVAILSGTRDANPGAS